MNTQRHGQPAPMDIWERGISELNLHFIFKKGEMLSFMSKYKQNLVNNVIYNELYEEVQSNWVEKKTIFL